MVSAAFESSDDPGEIGLFRVRYRHRDAREWEAWGEREFPSFDRADDFAGLMNEWFKVRLEKYDEISPGKCGWKEARRY